MLDAGDPIGKIKRDVQKSGLAVVKNTNLQGISAIALPIFDFSDRIAAVLTVLGPTGSFEASPSGPVAQAMRVEGAAISAALGHVA